MRHPAKYSDSVLDVMRDIIEESGVINILDPFAGSGGCYELETDAVAVIGLELEPEGHPWNVVTDCIEWMRVSPKQHGVQAIFTSPCYGNRFADKDMRESCAGTYMKWLGREASPGSACHLQWGPEYKGFHRRFIEVAFDFLPSGGLFVLNMSNHIRNGVEQNVVDWWATTMRDVGFNRVKLHQVETPRQRRGANHAARVECEWVIEFVKP